MKWCCWRDVQIGKLLGKWLWITTTKTLLEILTPSPSQWNKKLVMKGWTPSNHQPTSNISETELIRKYLVTHTSDTKNKYRCSPYWRMILTIDFIYIWLLKNQLTLQTVSSDIWFMIVGWRLSLDITKSKWINSHKLMKSIGYGISQKREPKTVIFGPL